MKRQFEPETLMRRRPTKTLQRKSKGTIKYGTLTVVLQFLWLGRFMKWHRVFLPMKQWYRTFLPRSCIAVVSHVSGSSYPWRHSWLDSDLQGCGPPGAPGGARGDSQGQVPAGHGEGVQPAMKGGVCHSLFPRSPHHSLSTHPQLA